MKFEFCIRWIPYCVLSKLMVIQLNIQCILLVITSKTFSVLIIFFTLWTSLKRTESFNESEPNPSRFDSLKRNSHVTKKSAVAKPEEEVAAEAFTKENSHSQEVTYQKIIFSIKFWFLGLLVEWGMLYILTSIYFNVSVGVFWLFSTLPI